VSQSDLISILAQCLSVLDDSFKKKTLEELGLITEHVTCAQNSMTTIQVLMRMNKEIRRPILGALPVVDENTGEIIGTFSASNLKGLRRGNFVSLLMPVMEYLQFQLQENTKRHFQATIQHHKALHPVTCTKDTTFEELVMKLASTKIHRIWVVNDMKFPVGVVSYGDVFKVFFPWFQS